MARKKKKNPGIESDFISLRKAIKYCDYTQEYLSLRARQGKLKAVKFGRNWLTKKEWIKDYIKQAEEYEQKKRGEGKRKPEIFSPQISLPPKFRPALALPNFVKQNLGGLALALVFVLLFSGIVFGRESLENVWQDTSLYVKEATEGIEQLVEEVNYDFTTYGNQISVGLVKGLESLGQGVAEFSKDTTRRVSQVAAVSSQIPREAGSLFREYFKWLGGELNSLFVEKPKALVESIKYRVLSIKYPKITLPKPPRITLRVPRVTIPKITVKAPKIPKIQIPKIQIPKIQIPKIQIPKITLRVPKIQLPELPEIRVPEIKAPRVKVPRISFRMPKIEIPTIEVPKIQPPKIAIRVPKIQVPKIQVPKIEVPKITIRAPRIVMPKIVFPKITLPKITLPKIALPKITLPKPTFPKLVLPEIRVEQTLERISGKAKEIGTRTSYLTRLFGRRASEQLRKGLEGLVLVAKIGREEFNNYQGQILINLSEGWESLVSGLQSGREELKEFVSRTKEFITRPWRVAPERVVVEEIGKEALEQAEGEIERLEEEIKTLKEEGLTVKEVTKETKVTEITKVEPVKEISKEVIKIDEEELRILKSQIKDIKEWESEIENLKEITKKLKARPDTPAVPTAPLYVASEGIQVGGHASLASLGVSGPAAVGMDLGVGGSAVLGSNVNNTLTVNATSTFENPVTIDSNLTVDNILSSTGQDLTLTVTNIDVVLGDDAGSSKFNIKDSGGVTVVYFDSDGNAVFSGEVDMTPSGNIVMPDDAWIGLGAAAGRIEFDDQATDEINILGANVGIGTTSPSTSLHISATDGVILPTGTTGQRPVIPTTGTIRYNTSTSQFEGYSATSWGSLGGLIDVDQDTYISAETTPGADNDELRFFTAGSEQMRIDSSGLVGIGTTTPSVSLHISATDGVILPVGTTAQRPGIPVTGTIRYNTSTSQFEGYSATSWGSLGGLIDVDQDTYISAETTPGADNDELRFFTAGTESFKISSLGVITIGTWNATALTDAYVSDTLTIGASGSVAEGAIPASITRDIEWDTWLEHPALTSAYLLLGNALNQATAVAISGDIAIDNTGLTTIQANSVTLATDTVGNYVLGLTEGNDIDITGTAGEGWSPTVAIESQLDTVTTISRASSNLTLQTTTSGDIIISPAGSVGIGAATPGALFEIEDSNGGLSFLLDTEESTGTTNVFQVISDSGSDENVILNLTAAGNLKIDGSLTTGGASTVYGDSLIYTDASQALSLKIGGAAGTQLFGWDTSGNVTVGDSGSTTAISSSDWGITSTGAMTGIGNITTDGNITLSTDDAWVGVGAAAERIVFDSDNDQIEIMGGSVGIGTDTPAGMVEIATGTTSGTALVIDQDDVDATAIDVDTANTSGNIINVDWAASTNQADAALSVLNIDLSNLTPDDDKALYAIHINDAASAGAGSLEYAFYIEGTNWDYGIYSADDVYIGGTTTLGSTLDLNGQELVLDADGDTSITADNDDRIDFKVGNADELVLTGTALYSATAEGLSLGSATNEFEAFYLGDDAGVYFGLDQDWHLTYDQATDTRLELTTSGTTGMLISSAVASGTGLTLEFDSVNTGTGLSLSLDALTTGKGLYLASTSTALTSGGLLSLDWSPGSATTATGDLLKVNIGSNATLTGNLLALYDNNSDVFRVATTQIESAVPHSFTAAGDVSVAYDIVMTNPTAAYLTFEGPGYLRSNNPSGNYDLTLSAANSGTVIVNDALVVDQDDTDATALDIDVAAVSGNVINLDWNAATTLTGAMIGLDLDFTNVTPDGSSAVYGLHINDLASTTGSTEYGLYLEGGNWDASAVFAGASNPQLRLTQSDGSLPADFQVAPTTGDLTITLSGDELIIDDNLEVCAGTCPSVGVSGTGDLVVENDVFLDGSKINYPSGLGTPKRSIVLTAAGAITPTSAGANQLKVDGTNHTYYVLDFDASSDEAAYWQWTQPDSYNDGTIDITYYWEAAAITGDVVWCFQAAGVAANGAEDIDPTLSTAVCETDTAQGNANDLALATESAATSNFAKGEYVVFKVFRDADNAADTMTGDARLVKVKIEYSVSTESD